MKRSTFILICFSYFSSFGQTPVIILVAGNGTGTHSGDGGPATSASIREPLGIAVDVSHGVYTSEHGYYLRKISGGVITTIAGIGVYGTAGDGGPATAASLDDAVGICIDDTGNILIADFISAHIRKINTAGTIYSLVSSGLAEPQGIAIDRHRNILIADVSAQCIFSLNSAGVITTVAGAPGVSGFAGDGGPATACQLAGPEGICVDKIGNIYISDHFNNRIRKIDTFGIINTVAGVGPTGGAFGSFGGDGGPATAANLYYPWGIGCDTIGNIFFADDGNARIRKINATGIITTVAGTGTAGYSGDGCAASAAQIEGETDIAVDNAGILYFTDGVNNRVRKIVLNHHIAFTGGHSQSLNLCVSSGAASINSLLAVTDADAGQTVNWSILTSPSHGALAATYTTTSTGSIMTPTGLSYTPTTGYTGTDVFKVVAVDCAGATDTTTVNVTVVNPPVAGSITGADTVCVGMTMTLSDTAAGGLWNSSNPNASVSAGLVTGLTSGADTIRYVVSNACGADTASLQIEVNACTTSAAELSTPGVPHLFPNPGDGVFTINVPSITTDNADIVVRDLTGRTLAKLKIPCNKDAEMKLNLAPGTYFLSAKTSSGDYKMKVVIN